jgi:hypothetical protein
MWTIFHRSHLFYPMKYVKEQERMKKSLVEERLWWRRLELPAAHVQQRHQHEICNAEDD